MKNRSGFSPVSILLGFAIGSTLFLLVMQVVTQLTVTLTQTVQLTDTQMSAMSALKILENDFTSSCMPLYVHYVPAENQKNQKESEQKELKGGKKEKPEYFKKAFFVKQTSELFEQSVCLSMYSISKDRVVPKKVFYTLEEDTRSMQQKRYTLYRQESANLLAESPEKEGQKFPVLKNIISLTVTAWARPEKNESKSDDPKQGQASEKKDKEKRKPYKSFKEWDSDKNYKERESSEECLPQLPSFIDIQLVLGQENKREANYTATIMMASGFPDIQFEGVTPIGSQDGKKESTSAQQQLDQLAKKADFSSSLNDKINSFVDPNKKNKPYG